MRGRDPGRRREWCEAQLKKILVRESKRESRTEARAGSSGSGPETRTGAKHRDCDGKQQPQLTSRVHGARTIGLNLEAEKPGECQDDRNTTCGRKRGSSGQQLEPEWTVTPSGREGEERMMSRAAPHVGEKIREVPKHQVMRLQDLLYNGQKRCISLS